RARAVGPASAGHLLRGERACRALAGHSVDPARATDRNSTVAAHRVWLFPAAGASAPGDALRPAGAKLVAAGARRLSPAGHGSLGRGARRPCSVRNSPAGIRVT